MASALQWLGHAVVSRWTQVPPPACPPDAPAGTWLLWADLSLSPGAPRVRLERLRSLARAAVSAPGSWRLARLRRRERRLAVLELSRTLLPPAADDEGDVEVDLVLDADAGDSVGLLAPCGPGAEGGVPIAGVAALRDGDAAGDANADAAHDVAPAAELRGLSFALALEDAVDRSSGARGADAIVGREVLLDTGMPAPLPALALGYRVVEAAASEQSRRSGGALQFLARVTEDAKCVREQPLLDNLRRLTSHCSWVTRYPVYVLHTASLEGVDLPELLAWSDEVRVAAGSQVEVRFLDVSDDFARVRIGDARARLDDLDLLWMDLPHPDSSRIRRSKPRRLQTGYRHMCRFQSTSVLELPIFATVQYLLHMDTDATLLCAPGGVDPIEEMARAGSVYGLFETGVEDPEYAEGWTGFLEEYATLHELRPPVARAQLSSRGAIYTKAVEERPGEMYNASTDKLAVTWGTAWEILDLGFFNSPRVLEFSRKVERSLGHYRYNWGDHLVRAFQVQLFAPLSAVRCFDAREVPGAHGCSARDTDEDEFVFQFLEGLACPDQWDHDNLVVEAVPWAIGDNNASPRACLELCNDVADCTGFDLVFFPTLGVADCRLRRGWASEEGCQAGGAAGGAGAAWRAVGTSGEVDDANGVVIGATNRFQIIERNVKRTMDCDAWRSRLEARLIEAEESGEPRWQ
eukprot:TRINITY_DN72567_c0_g1_i1.p1 TRINITY_DN72567_c0_g1~~TRINITY_DN72567_c0_g1_i1.p1  ORF type:complete len:717 (+),score=157.31 TRINITY_DN72567_c0_g1_i1:79-2151(+)